MFWPLALAILAAAAGLTLWPLLSGGVRQRTLAAVLVLSVPALAAWLYFGVGTPAALDPGARQAIDITESDIEDMTDRLRARLSERAEDLEGWILLGRTYKTLQRYPEALSALETADRLVPGNPMVMVELVEARLFVSGDPRIGEDSVAMLERAVSEQPDLQKGYWLLGIAAAQRGDDRAAISWWETLLERVEPGGGVAVAVTEQIAQARLRLGEPAAETSAPSIVTASESAAPPAATGTGVEFTVEVSAPDATLAAVASLPPEAALFIIVRPAGVAVGPPLGVRRIARPQFPLTVTLSDADSMLSQSPISSAGDIEIQARLSLSGQPLPATGDWQSRPATPGTAAPTPLVLDQQVP